MTLKQPKAVLFDWDNTLVDTWPVIHAALHEMFVVMEKTPWTLEEVKQRVKHSARDAFPALFGNDWQRAADLYRDFYRAKNLETLTPLPQAKEVLDALYDKGVSMAIVSNKMGDTLRKECAHLGWDKYFTALIGSSDTEHDKPHPLPVFTALGEVKPSDDMWFMGDSVVDLEVAIRAGLTPILYGPVTPEKAGEYGGFAFTRHYREHAETLTELSRF
jgi:phosphoglycolate phosphatase